MNEEDKKIMALNKLNYLSEIKAFISDVHTMRKKIREEVDMINVEDKCLVEFKREMESLNQEKMTHVEELRQIHSDINMLDNVQKQGEEERNRRMDAVKDLYQQVQLIKGKVDKMCGEMDMPRMFENDEEPFDLADKRFINIKSGSETCLESRSMGESQPNRLASSANRPLNDNTNTGIGNNPVGSFTSSLASLMSGFQDNRHQSPYGRMMSGAAPTAGSGLGSAFHPDQTSSTNASSPAAFRQQPPPMKSCGSCHQQIHRNAPICPLCKAKSRSRHPKRRNNQRN